MGNASTRSLLSCGRPNVQNSIINRDREKRGKSKSQVVILKDRDCPVGHAPKLPFSAWGRESAEGALDESVNDPVISVLRLVSGQPLRICL